MIDDVQDEQDATLMQAREVAHQALLDHPWHVGRAASDVVVEALQREGLLREVEK